MAVMPISRRSPIRPTFTALAAVAVGACALLLQACSETDPIQKCLDEDSVWVVVEFDDDTKGACASEFSTGLQALESAGFTAVASDDGFLTTIDAQPATAGAEDWWSYAHADADLAEWEFYEVGAKDSQPVAGSIEGWRLLHSFAAEDTVPQVSPAEMLAGK